MKSRLKIYSLVIFFSFLCLNSYCQNNIYFTKTPNQWIEADKYGKQLSIEKYDNTRYEFNFNVEQDKGKLIATQSNGEKWVMDLEKLSSDFNNPYGYKVYYFRSRNRQFKISTTREENGLAIYNYKNQVLTIFYTKK